MDNKRDQYFFISGAVSTLLFGIGYYNLRSSRILKNQEKSFKNQRIYTPDEIKNIIDKNEPLVHKLFTRNEEGNKLIGKNMIIQGRINNQDSLKSILEIGKDTQLVMRINYEFPFYSNEDTYKILSEKTMYSDYYLKKKEQGVNIKTKIQPVIILEKNDVHCQVIVNDKFDQIDKQCFDYTDSKMIMDDSSPLKYIWNSFAVLIAGLTNLIIHKDIRDLICFRIKVDNCEIGIRNLGIVSVLGDIVYNKDRGELTVPNPIRLMKNKLEYLENLRSQISTKECLFALFYFSSFVGAGVSLKFLYQQVQEKTHLTLFGRQIQVPIFIINSMRRLRNYINTRNPNAKTNLEIVELIDQNQNAKSLESVYTQPREEMECIICYQRCRSVIIRPCLHCSMCYQCYISLQKKECPVCKSPIKNQIQIFQEKDSSPNNSNTNNNNNIQINNGNSNNNNNISNSNKNNRNINNNHSRHNSRQQNNGRNNNSNNNNRNNNGEVEQLQQQ